jgi:hypothetical protein
METVPISARARRHGSFIHFLRKRTTYQETFVLAKSGDRAAKEQAMHERFVHRIEEGLKKIAAAASSGRLKDAEQAGPAALAAYWVRTVVGAAASMCR